MLPLDARDFITLKRQWHWDDRIGAWTAPARGRRRSAASLSQSSSSLTAQVMDRTSSVIADKNSLLTCTTLVAGASVLHLIVFCLFALVGTLPTIISFYRSDYHISSSFLSLFDLSCCVANSQTSVSSSHRATP